MPFTIFMGCPLPIYIFRGLPPLPCCTYRGYNLLFKSYPSLPSKLHRGLATTAARVNQYAFSGARTNANCQYRTAVFWYLNLDWRCRTVSLEVPRPYHSLLTSCTHRTSDSWGLSRFIRKCDKDKTTQRSCCRRPKYFTAFIQPLSRGAKSICQ